MIKSREERKRSTLLKRRRIAIIISLVLVAVLTVSCILIYDYFNTTIVFTDVDERQTKYYIKKVDGVFAMYDANGALLPTDSPLGSSEIYYVTACGTTVDVDEETGEYKIKSIPAIYFAEDGEHLDHLLITLFKAISEKEIRQIEIKNQNDTFVILRYLHSELRPDDSGSLVLKSSPFSTIDPDLLSYITYYAGHSTMRARLDDPIRDARGEFSEYGLVPEKRIGTDGKEYDYTPTQYTVTTTSGVKHTMIIGDKLIDGSGYYAQYVNSDGVKRDAVYIFCPTDQTAVNGAHFGNTLLAASKDLVIPSIVYPMSQNDYFDVRQFSVKKKLGEALDEIIRFSFVDTEDRTGTVNGIHPYVFDTGSFVGYHPNYTNIDVMLQGLTDPNIVGVAVLNPSPRERAEYGLMRENGVDENGMPLYAYDPWATFSFVRTLQSDDGQSNVEVLQTVYVSPITERSTYYTYTELRFLNSDDKSKIKGVTFDMICEVSKQTLNFLSWDTEDWVYKKFMEIGILYTKKIEIIKNGYSATFMINNYKTDGTSVTDVDATNSKGEDISTFGVLKFTDIQGNKWTVTPESITLIDANGNEARPSTRHYEINSVGQSVAVIDQYAVVKGTGDLVYIEKDYIKIKHLDGSVDTILRYHTLLFKRVFASITGISIVDSVDLSDEEHKTVTSANNHILTIRITDSEDTVHTYSFYNYTARKAYLTIGESDAALGGFYVQTSHINNALGNIDKFFAGEYIEDPF